MRMNTFDCAMYHHTNLVPDVYELDDYQVRTPTDIIGQHIHLPKWDLTTTDGSANGWNYEDGTLSPGRGPRAHRRHQRLQPAAAPESGRQRRPAPERALSPPSTHFASPAHRRRRGPDWMGARTTLQRWFSDPVVNAAGEHRGLGIIFTHDHYGPSTHQQIGLYATVLVEPPGSHLGAQRDRRAPLLRRRRADGGPTSWQAAILTGDTTATADDSYREFYFEYTDFQHAYEPGIYVGRDQNGALGAAAGREHLPPGDQPAFRQERPPAVRQRRFPEPLAISRICPAASRAPARRRISARRPGHSWW